MWFTKPFLTLDRHKGSEMNASEILLGILLCTMLDANH